MTDNSHRHGETVKCAAARYISRVPEDLVLNGYRGWLLFALERDERHLNTVQEAFRRSMKGREIHSALNGLHRLIRELGTCATCPLRFKPPNTKHICRDECLILAMVSGLQHDNKSPAFESAAALTCPARATQVLGSGGEFAMALKSAGQHLLPINVDVVRWVILRNEKMEHQTIH